MILTSLIQPIGELIRFQATERAGELAYEDASRTISFGQLGERTANLAGHLRELGLMPGQAVALYLPNSVDWIEACLGVARAGGIVVPISYEATNDEVAYRLSDASCTFVVTRVQQAERIKAQLPNGILVLAHDDENLGDYALEVLLSSSSIVDPRDPEALDEPRFIIYTSGTTGRAKGVLLTERSMLWDIAAGWAPIMGLGGKDCILSPLPLFHSYGLNVFVLGVLATGASGYILERFSAQAVLKLINGGRFTVLPGVPTMFHYLLNAARDAGLKPTTSLRLCLSAGAIMPAALNADFEALFGVPLLDGYGITETSTMVTLNWPQGGRAMGSCGLPLPGLAVRILDHSTGQDAPLGSEGELLVRGPNLMLGYHNKPEETASALRGGWYHTGDLGRSDVSGFLTVTGRLKELIIRGGQNIAPAEVEETMAAFPAVLDCAVVGVAHPLLGEVPVAFVVERTAKAIDQAALIEHCKHHLSAYKVPAAVHIVSEIPRTGSGKIMRFRLHDRLTAES